MEVVRISDGVVIEVMGVTDIPSVQDYYPDCVFVERVGEENTGGTYANGVFTPPSNWGGVASSTRITRLAFLNRFSDEEAVAIDLASQGATYNAAMMRRAQKRIDAASFIELTDSNTIAGVMTLESVGLLSQGRAAQILSADTQLHELYVGAG